MEQLLTPPIAFLIYIPLVLLLVLLGKALAPKSDSQTNILKASLYGSGEKAPTGTAAPGYTPFFLVAFFFAIIHLGILVLATGNLSSTSMVYLFGLVLGLVALILG